MLTQPYVPNYEEYDYEAEWHERSIEDRAEKEIIGRWLEPSRYCLELGGGFGRVTKILEPYFETVFMVDYSKRHLASAAAHLKKTSILRTEIRRLPFKEDIFDCIVIVRVLHHIEDVRTLLDETVRVGRDDATLIIGVPNTKLGRYRGIKLNQRVLIGPQRHRAYVYPLEVYSHPSLKLLERRGTGFFDNPIGRKLERVQVLSRVDVATSAIWTIKPELFMKFRIEKGRAPKA
jgi:SAM-dependent methyltransferase